MQPERSLGQFSYSHRPPNAHPPAYPPAFPPAYPPASSRLYAAPTNMPSHNHPGYPMHPASTARPVGHPFSASSRPPMHYPHSFPAQQMAPIQMIQGHSFAQPIYPSPSINAHGLRPPMSAYNRPPSHLPPIPLQHKPLQHNPLAQAFPDHKLVTRTEQARPLARVPDREPGSVRDFLIIVNHNDFDPVNPEFQHFLPPRSRDYLDDRVSLCESIPLGSREASPRTLVDSEERSPEPTKTATPDALAHISTQPLENLYDSPISPTLSLKSHESDQSNSTCAESDENEDRPAQENFRPTFQTLRRRRSLTHNHLGEGAKLVSFEKTLELYRANAKRSGDPDVQFEFAK